MARLQSHCTSTVITSSQPANRCNLWLQMLVYLPVGHDPRQHYLKFRNQTETRELTPFQFHIELKP